MKTLEEVKNILEQHKKELRQSYKVKDIGIFGSVVRGEQNRKSDVDILVDFEKGADLFHLVGVGLFLEERLGQRLDIVPKRALRKELKEAVLKEVVSV